MSGFSLPTGIFDAIASAVGLAPAPMTVLSAPSDISDLQAKQQKIAWWGNVLTSRNRLTPTSSRPYGSKTAQAVPLWLGGIGQEAKDALQKALDDARSLFSPPDADELAQYQADKADANAKYAKAVVQAQQISDLFDADAKAMAQGVTVSDFTPAAIVQPGYDAVTGAASRAAGAISRATAAASQAAFPYIKYAAIGAAALTGLYALGLARPFLPNPARRRRRR